MDITTADFFENNGYVVIKNIVTKEQCVRLTNYMFSLYDRGKLFKDNQCPVSDAIYGDPVFDNLLQELTTALGNKINKNILPTYTYGRIYRPGEILKKHKDRPACEISATLTLGFNSKTIWPIFFDEEKEIAIELDVGDLALYKGCKIVHWRNEFKGTWHIQLFLHYVSAEGPYASQFKDGRSHFGTQKTLRI